MEWELCNSFWNVFIKMSRYIFLFVLLNDLTSATNILNECKSFVMSFVKAGSL